METWLIGIGFVLGGGIILSWIMGTRAALADMDWYRNKELMQWGVLTGAFTAALSAFIAVLVVSSWWAATLWWLALRVLDAGRRRQLYARQGVGLSRNNSFDTRKPRARITLPGFPSRA